MIDATFLKIVRGVGIVLLSCYCALLTALYLNQERLIFRGMVTKGTPEARFVPPGEPGCAVALKTRRGIPLAGYWTPTLADAAQPRRTILFFYGNACCIGSCWDIVDHFRALGCDVMIVDYPGYGGSGGEASEKGCYDAANAAYNYLTVKRHVPADRIVAAGWSLGSAVAIHLAANRPVAGLVTFSAFTTMATMASRQYPIVPEFISRLLLKYRFPSLQMIKHVHAPTFLAHGALDTFVPPAMSHLLAAADSGPVTHVIVPNVGHNDILSSGGPALYNALAAWIDRLPKKSAV